jgi:hypothetical protein
MAEVNVSLVMPMDLCLHVIVFITAKIDLIGPDILIPIGDAGGTGEIPETQLF